MKKHRYDRTRLDPLGNDRRAGSTALMIFSERTRFALW